MPDSLRMNAGRKIAVDGQYEPIEFGVSYESDRNPLESDDEMISRVQGVVVKAFNAVNADVIASFDDKRHAALQGGGIKAPPPPRKKRK